MKIDKQVLRTALVSYAVMLNRPAWLTPERLDMQQAVWARLIDAQDGDATIKLIDLETAITAELHGTRALNDITPTVIIDDAASATRNRASRMRQYIDTINNPSQAEVTFASAIAAVRRAYDAGEDGYPVIRQFRETIREDIMNGDVADDVIMDVLDAFDRLPLTSDAGELNG